ncbi:MAG: hypothetical protein ACTS22_02930 [Phycisphaerales bacterium]
MGWFKRKTRHAPPVVQHEVIQAKAEYLAIAYGEFLLASNDDPLKERFWKDLLAIGHVSKSIVELDWSIGETDALCTQLEVELVRVGFHPKIAGSLAYHSRLYPTNGGPEAVIASYACRYLAARAAPRFAEDEDATQVIQEMVHEVAFHLRVGLAMDVVPNEIIAKSLEHLPFYLELLGMPEPVNFEIANDIVAATTIRNA